MASFRRHNTVGASQQRQKNEEREGERGKEEEDLAAVAAAAAVAAEVEGEAGLEQAFDSRSLTLPSSKEARDALLAAGRCNAKGPELASNAASRVSERASGASGVPLHRSTSELRAQGSGLRSQGSGLRAQGSELHEACGDLSACVERLLSEH